MEKKKYKIEILHPASYIPIFQLWFEREGTRLHDSKIERKTIGQMKEYYEELAGIGEQIDLPYIKYFQK